MALDKIGFERLWVQIIARLGEKIDKCDALSVDLTDVEQGTATGINADTLGGVTANNYVLETELDIYKTETLNNILQNASIDLEGATETGETVLANADLLAGMTYRQIMDMVHPIGFVFITAEEGDLNELYPWQTWFKAPGGIFVMSAGDGYPLGSMGGEATHTLSVSEMPAHNHKIIRPQWYYSDSDVADNNSGAIFAPKGTSKAYFSQDSEITSMGGGEAHNNMPPYIAANMWVRTA